MTNLLARFNEEVLEQGLGSALPVRLNNEWLNILEQSLSVVLENNESIEDEDFESTHMSLVMVAVFHILQDKEGDKNIVEFSISLEQLLKYLQDYSLEITIEIMNRNTEMKIEPATIETIFTNRQIVL